MCLIGIEAAQVFIVIFIEEVELIIDKPGVFFLEYLLEDALYLVAVAVITAVFATSSMKNSERHLMPSLNSLRSLRSAP